MPWRRFRERAFEIHEDKAGAVPDLVGEVFKLFKAAAVEIDLARMRGAGAEGHAHRIGAIGVDDLEGIDDVAFGFRHLFPFGMDVGGDGLRRDRRQAFFCG